MTTEEKNIQKTIDKLLSIEIILYMLYHGAISATKHSYVFAELFNKIADIKLNNYRKIKEFAEKNEFNIPFKIKDYEKNAKDYVKQLENLKLNQSPIYYVNEILKSEAEILKIHEEESNLDYIPQMLQALILQNFYDKCQYIDQLTTLKYALEDGVTEFLTNY